MLSNTFAAWLDRRGIHYAWVVAATTFCAMFVTAAALSLPSVLLQPLSSEFGWTTGQLSSTLAVRFALFGLMAPFSAILMERFGLQRVVCAAIFLTGASMLLATQATELWQLFILWGLGLGVGSGLTALVLGATVSNRWFKNHKGLVIGALTASSATGQLVFLPLAAWIIKNHGWRAAVLPVACASVTLLIITALFMRNRPEDVGLLAYGDQGPRPQPGHRVAPRKLENPFRILKAASRSTTFWILLLTFFICGLSTNGLVQTHFISLCGDYGLTAIPAASVLAMMGIFDVVGTVTSGWLSDKYDNRKLLFWYYGLRGLSLFWLPHSTFTLYGLSIFAMFYGLDWIATVPPTVRLVAQRFGGERAPFVFGWIFAAHQVGAATAAWGAGLTRTLLLTYTPALYVAGGACLIAAIAVMAVTRNPKLDTGGMQPA